MSTTELRPISRMARDDAYTRTVKSLCEQIDDLEDEVCHWYALYEKERAAYNKMLFEQRERTERDLSNA